MLHRWGIATASAPRLLILPLIVVLSRLILSLRLISSRS